MDTDPAFPSEIYVRRPSGRLVVYRASTPEGWFGFFSRAEQGRLSLSSVLQWVDKLVPSWLGDLSTEGLASDRPPDRDFCLCTSAPNGQVIWTIKPQFQRFGRTDGSTKCYYIVSVLNFDVFNFVIGVVLNLPMVNKCNTLNGGVIADFIDAEQTIIKNLSQNLS
ncbi:hypothetical protein TNCV_2962371 [Trichonephila clavipes]|nr:hypothetical protein TNCV_2962371 [Trichonephila clavipes]